MEPVALLSFQGLLSIVAALGVGGWVGHTIGRNREAERKAAALAEAEAQASDAIAGLKAENQKKLDVLNKANSNEIEGLKQTHSQQIDQINHAHHGLVESLKAGYSDEMKRLEGEHNALIDRLTANNNANLNEIEERRERALAEIRSEHQAAVEALRSDHSATVEQLTRDRDQRLREAEQRGAEQKQHLEALLADVRGERDGFRSRASELEADLAELRDEVKEAKLNNMFSVSKSGEKLIRVVRSVQELASELDETSRTVTGGDYSFFEQIKDERDRDTVLSLAAGRPTYAGDAGAGDSVTGSMPPDDAAETDDTSTAGDDGESRPG
jgi:hypothetical protein